MRKTIGAWTLGAFILLAAPAFAATNNENPPDPDNTKVNKAEGMTADDQGMNASDTELTKKIRAEVVKDKSLSTYAHNVKIIASAGHVTLKGPVRTAAEKATIEKIATKIAGADSVMNELTIATN